MANFSSKLKIISVVSVGISGRLAVLHKSSVALDVLTYTHDYIKESKFLHLSKIQYSKYKSNDMEQGPYPKELNKEANTIIDNTVCTNKCSVSFAR